MNKKKRKVKKPKAKGKKHEKMAPRNPGIVEKLVNRALKQQGNVHYAPKAHNGLQTLFKEMFVEPSANQGLLGDTKSLRSLVMVHQLKLVAVHTANYSVTVVNKETGNVIAFENFLILMQILAGIVAAKNITMDEISL